MPFKTKAGIRDLIADIEEKLADLKQSLADNTPSTDNSVSSGLKDIQVLFDSLMTDIGDSFNQWFENVTKPYDEKPYWDGPHPFEDVTPIDVGPAVPGVDPEEEEEKEEPAPQPAPVPVPEPAPQPAPVPVPEPAPAPSEEDPTYTPSVDDDKPAKSK